MRNPGFFLLLAFILLSVQSNRSQAQQRANADSARQQNSHSQDNSPASEKLGGYHIAAIAPAKPSVKPTSPSTGIREVIPDKFKSRYAEWKREFLATETGRRQWETYQQNTKCLLTITIARNERHGAGTGDFKWADSGELASATITLGFRIDEGYPNPIYYPVMNSLYRPDSPYGVDGNILAAAKIAHEFGHVNRMATTDGEMYRLQSQLIPQYNKILLSNGRNVRDPRLLELARRMGGTPVEIWEDSEYWGEANAMIYLGDRITKESFRCSLFNRIKQTVVLYADSYVDRFGQIAQSKSALCW
jgi:hypothetical protein